MTQLLLVSTLKQQPRMIWLVYEAAVQERYSRETLASSSQKSIISLTVSQDKSMNFIYRHILKQKWFL
jgi:hypothetical protein